MYVSAVRVAALDEVLSLCRLSSVKFVACGRRRLNAGITQPLIQTQKSIRAQSRSWSVCALPGALFFMTPGNRQHMGDPDRVAAAGRTDGRTGKKCAFVGGTETQLAVTRFRAIAVRWPTRLLNKTLQFHPNFSY